MSQFDSGTYSRGIDAVEAIRQRMVSLLVDSEGIRRLATKVQREGKNKPRETLLAIKDAADRIDRETRELYHLLPEQLRPNNLKAPQKPRELHPDGSEIRRIPRPKLGVPIPRNVRWPDWTIERILAIIDEFQAKRGKWPMRYSGRISDASPDTWNGIDLALKRGNRNLPGGSSLVKLLWEMRGVPLRIGPTKLSETDILEWIDDHCRATGSWPTINSGAVHAAPEFTWRRVDGWLRKGCRGLYPGSSLARLLLEHRGVHGVHNQEPITEQQLLAWMDAHHERKGKWPTRDSGDIPEAPGENWARIDNALIHGFRGLPKGLSIARFLAIHRGVRNRKDLPPYDLNEVHIWVGNHYARHGRWPSCWSGKIDDAPGETWGAVDSAFKAGIRGLAGSPYRSLAHFLDETRGKLQRRGNRPADRRINTEQN